MPNASVMVMDGIIRKNKDDGIIMQGMFLYHALASAGRLAVLCGEDREHADRFLKINNMSKHAYLIPEDPASGSTTWLRRQAQIGFLRQEKFGIDFVVEADPALAANLILLGIPTILFVHPQFSLPSFRPDYKSTAVPWNALIEEINYQQDLKANQVFTEED